MLNTFKRLFQDPQLIAKDNYGITTRDRKRRAIRPPSITDHLPWMDYCQATQTFILEDGRSRGLLFELTPTASEARTDEFLQKRCEEIEAALSSIPEMDDAEWIVQTFVNDDDNIEALKDTIRDYIHTTHGNPERANSIIDSAYTQHFLDTIDEHFRFVSTPEGFFKDDAVAGHAWRAQRRRIRCVLYRRYPANYDFSHEVLDSIELLQQTGEGFMAALREAGVQSKRCNEQDLYEWLFPFFNGKADHSHHNADLLAKYPYPKKDEATNSIPFGRDFAEQLLLDMPKLNTKDGIVEFNGVPMRALTLQSLKRKPQIGHFTAERRYDDKLYARFDRLPAGTMLSMTMVVRAQDKVKNFVQSIADASRARTADARYTAEEARHVLHRMAKGDKLFPLFVTLYIRGIDKKDLRKRIAAVNAQLHATGLHFIEPRHDVLGVDAFLRGLPMNFDPVFDARDLKRSRFVFVSHIASLLPFYGRARGSGRPGFLFWNRGGEPLWFDPLSRYDRKKNAHLLMLGPTGAGKSATGVFLAMLMLAIYRPRIIIAEVGGSFNLLGDYCQAHGLTVNQVTLTAQSDVSLPPFASAHDLLMDPTIIATVDDDDDKSESDATVNDDDEKRDLLGEMIITARLMITGGEATEIAKMSRADRYLIANAILLAAQQSKDKGSSHPLSEDVAQALMDLRLDESLGEERRCRAEEMGQSMLVFCDRGLRGRLFNRVGSNWPDTDLTIVNLATLAQEGYEDALAVAYIGLMNHTQALAEKHQYDDRPTIFITDEGHIITTNPLLCPYAVKITKMWRKLGTWFWLFTQNMKDFPDQATRILNMCEWWLLLTMDRDEIEQVSRFRTLTDEQRSLMESATKEPPKYTEGVILSATQQALFRNVPPALPIALAMTEKHEKAERRRIMQEMHCTELEAAIQVSRKMVKHRG